jgi:thioredoxin reductase (NADPH)
MGYGVSACATCDGFFFRDKEVVVVGGGDTAMEEATFLTKFASKVTVIHRRDELRASKIMQDRAFANSEDRLDLGHRGRRDRRHARGGRRGRPAAQQADRRQRLPHPGGLRRHRPPPNTELFRGKIDMNDVGYIEVQEPTTRTNVPGVFACGDAMDPIYRQAVTAAGTGCRAAMDAERWLEAAGLMASQ